MNKFIIQQIATKYNIPKKQVELLLDGFYRGLRYYLEHADETKGGIVITNYMKFFIDQHREMRSIEIALTNGVEPKRIEVFNNLIKYKHNKKSLSKRDYERQTSIQNYYALYNEQEPDCT